MNERYRCPPGTTQGTEQEWHTKIAKQCRLGIVEIGVLEGFTTSNLARSNPKVPCFGIDPIVADSMNAALIGSVEKIRENTAGCPNFHFVQDYSYNVVKDWKQPFDYIFVDGDHTYDAVKRDFEDWFPLLAPGGYVTFHDSAMYRGGQPYHDGSSRFVDEVVLEHPGMEYVATDFCMTIMKKKQDLVPSPVS